MTYRLILTAEQLKNNEEILATFTAIPNEDDSLDLSDTDFVAADDPAIWTRAFVHIPQNIKHLYLSHNNLGLMTLLNLVGTLRAITSPLSILDVSNNALSELSTSASLGEFLAVAPASTLILRGNGLGTLGPLLLSASLYHLHPDVSHLDLNNNLLETKSLTELQFIFSQLPHTVTHIRYNTEEYLERAEFDRRLGINQESLRGHENIEIIATPPFNSTFYLKCLAGLALASGALLVIGILLAKTALVYTGAALLVISAGGAMGLAMHSFFANQAPAQSQPVDDDTAAYLAGLDMV